MKRGTTPVFKTALETEAVGTPPRGGGGGPSNQGMDRLGEVQQKLDTATGVMQDNVGIMLTNLDKANALDKSTEELAKTANQCAARRSPLAPLHGGQPVAHSRHRFKKGARKVRRKEWLNRCCCCCCTPCAPKELENEPPPRPAMA